MAKIRRNTKSKVVTEPTIGRYLSHSQQILLEKS
jgi:hypothetical protein